MAVIFERHVCSNLHPLKPRPSDADKYRPSEGRSKLREYVFDHPSSYLKGNAKPIEKVREKPIRWGETYYKSAPRQQLSSSFSSSAWRWRRLLIFKTQVKRKSLRPFIGTGLIPGGRVGAASPPLRKNRPYFALTPLPPQNSSAALRRRKSKP